MSYRQYMSLSADGLNALATQHWNSVSTLRAIEQECGYRKSKRAQSIRSRVRQRIDDLQGRAGGPPADDDSPTGESAFARVGLHPNAPQFVIEAARKAWRKHLHPDGHAHEAKADAEEKFKRIEIAFDEIFKSRSQS